MKKKLSDVSPHLKACDGKYLSYQEKQIQLLTIVLLMIVLLYVDVVVVMFVVVQVLKLML